MLETARPDGLDARRDSIRALAIVAAWGYFLYQGVHGSAGRNQFVVAVVRDREPVASAVALCVATTIVIKMGLAGCACGEC